MSTLTTFTTEQLSEPGNTAVAEALETNHIVYFPTCPIPLPDEATLRYLRSELPEHLKLKNVSYHPEADRVTGVDGDPETTARVTKFLKEHQANIVHFLSRHMGHLANGWTVGTCSFRPIQERGRNIKAHASSELMHVDAGAYGATDGDRILRFFVNFNDREDRVWATKGPIEDMVSRYGRDAGLLDAQGRLAVRLTKRTPDRMLSAVVRGLSHMNPLARVLDTSPYDRAMRRLHNYMKDDEGFKQDPRGYQQVRFPPYSAWMVFADSVSHACVSGQFASITTIIVRREQMRHPECSPFNVLMARHASRSSAAEAA